MISNENLLDVYNYLKGVYIPENKSIKDGEEVFRSLLQSEVYKQYSSSSEDKCSYELVTDLLIGYTLSSMINSKENYDIINFEYYFSYSYMRYNSGKKEMEEKLSIFSDKLHSYNIDNFLIDYKYFADGSVRKFGVNLEAIYNTGFKLNYVEKGHCLFTRVNEE